MIHTVNVWRDGSVNKCTGRQHVLARVMLGLKYAAIAVPIGQNDLACSPLLIPETDIWLLNLEHRALEVILSDTQSRCERGVASRTKAMMTHSLSPLWQRQGVPPSCYHLAPQRAITSLNTFHIRKSHQFAVLALVTPGIRVSAIIDRICVMFNTMVKYKKAWKAKHKALARTFDNWDRSYAIMPRWLEEARRINPGTVVFWEHMPHLDAMCFHRVFWTFASCIAALRHLRPILQIDETFLYGKYSGTLLLAVGQDGNKKVVPLAFAIVEKENESSWHWFLTKHRVHLVRDRIDICLISYRHQGILNAVNDERLMWHPPYADNVYCVKHLSGNLNKAYKNAELKKLFFRTGREGDLDHTEGRWKWTKGSQPKERHLCKDDVVYEDNLGIDESRELRSRRSCAVDDGLPPPSIVSYLIQAGFYNVSRVGHFLYSRSLIIALVERWRPKTHTFPFPQGECTVTLQDVALQLGLPCNGFLVTGTDKHNYRALCMELLGVELPQQRQMRKGQRLSMTPPRPPSRDPPADIYQPLPPLSAKWQGMFTTARPATMSHQRYRQIIDLMDECGDIDWIPYSLMLERGKIPNGYVQDSDIWRCATTELCPCPMAVE
ncbi:uncharacterized protein G2W53_004604 [Senna tora]|uniref:MULE transposase domain-containing protein n=1 Tax=Senna tora TaxID=362788 RepID=A0A835CGL6_9FABA|nr:uncharacterized protein G2W53_004604 [Senna tora]